MLFRVLLLVIKWKKLTMTQKLVKLQKQVFDYDHDK